jgi:hypothetical protein
MRRVNILRRSRTTIISSSLCIWGITAEIYQNILHRAVSQRNNKSHTILYFHYVVTISVLENGSITRSYNCALIKKWTNCFPIFRFVTISSNTFATIAEDRQYIHTTWRLLVQIHKTRTGYEWGLGYHAIQMSLYWLQNNFLDNSSSHIGQRITISPPLWSNGQSSWLQIRRPGFDSRHYQKKLVGSGTGSTQPREYNCGATW